MRKNLWRLSWLYKDDNGNKNKKRDIETNTLNNPKINKGKTMMQIEKSQREKNDLQTDTQRNKERYIQP